MADSPVTKPPQPAPATVHQLRVLAACGCGPSCRCGCQSGGPCQCGGCH